MPFRQKLKRQLVLAVPIVLVAIPSVLPTRLGALSSEFPPIEDRSARVPLAPGVCGLNRVAAPDGACAPLIVSSVREEEVTFASSIPEKGIAALRGTLSIPVGAPGPRPAIILIHGSGAHDRNCAIPGDIVTTLTPPFEVFRDLAEFFAHEGLVVLRWDKRGPKLYPELAAPGKDELFRFSDFETDARDAIKWLATRPEVDPRAIVVAGHSEGGGLAPRVAQGEPHVAAVMILAGFPDTFDAAVWQVRNFAGVRLRQLDVIQWVVLEHMASSYAKCIAKLSTDYVPSERCLAPNITQAQLKDAMEYQAKTPDAIRALSVPVIALQGSVDRNIAPDTIPRFRDMLRGHDAELHYIPRVSHPLVDAIETPTPARVDEQVKARLRAFLASVAR